MVERAADLCGHIVPVEQESVPAVVPIVVCISLVGDVASQKVHGCSCHEHLLLGGLLVIV